MSCCSKVRQGEQDEDTSFLHYDSDVETIDKDEILEGRRNSNDKKETSDFQTSWNMMNLIQGMGVLGIPYAISIGGYAVIPDILLVGWITNYTSKAIIECQYEEEGSIRLKPRPGYPAIGKVVWKKYGSQIISITQLAHLFGACMLYLLLISRFLEDCLIEQLGSHMMCKIASGVILLPTVFFSNMKQLSWLSLVSVCLIDCTFTVLIIYSFTQFKNWKVNDLVFFDFQGFFIAHSIVLFSYVAHPYLPRIEDGMKNPKNYKKVSNISFATATMVKTIFGVSVAFCYGETTKQEISRNLQGNALRKTISGCLAFVGYCSSPMPAAVMTNIIQRAHIEHFSFVFPMVQLKKTMTWSEKYIDIGMRTCLVILTVIVASLIPEFSLLMAVFGSCTAVLLTIIFPMLFYHGLLKSRNTNVLMLTVLFGILSGAIGFVNSFMKIVHTMKKTVPET